MRAAAISRTRPATTTHIYDDAPPVRRRMGVMAIAAVFALAVIGTAGALGYRALFGSSAPSQPPPVIKADTAPSKIVPASASKTPNKLITDRVPDHAQGEKLVSREEKPVEMKDKPVAAVPPINEGNVQPSGAQTAALDGGVIANEPKKIHTIAIHPDQMSTGESRSMVPPAAAPVPPPAPMAAPAPVCKPRRRRESPAILRPRPVRQHRHRGWSRREGRRRCIAPRLRLLRRRRMRRCR